VFLDKVGNKKKILDSVEERFQHNASFDPAVMYIRNAARIESCPVDSMHSNSGH
jgi:hypothetical protein